MAYNKEENLKIIIIVEVDLNLLPLSFNTWKDILFYDDFRFFIENSIIDFGYR